MSKDETGKPIKTTPAMSFDLACYCASQAVDHALTILFCS